MALFGRFVRSVMSAAVISALAFGGLVLVGGEAVAQSGDADSEEAQGLSLSVPVALAVRVARPPVLDGRVVDDPTWLSAEPATGFRQTRPDEGQPATQRTEVRIVYTEDTLYFGVVCFDTDPNGIIMSDSRRDSSLDDTDSFQIVLDTYLDQQNGFVFGTNPAGLEFDGQLVNEGQGGGRFGRGGGRTQGGAGGGFNLNWDGSWQVATQISEIGWSAEFAIPFRTIRYPSGQSQTWSMNFQRNIRRNNETAFWAPLPRQYGLYRLSMAGRLSGLEVPAQRNLKITPYVLSERLRQNATTSRPRLDDWTGDFGTDLKYSITPALTLDATYNTDFAQVEVDEQQVNLNRFNLFFPEKRPFFLENAGLFTVGNPGQTEIFFSRRIGIGPEGEVIPIVGGGRLSGQVGNGFNVGFLNMQTDTVDEPDDPVAANNFTVARVRKDLGNRSNVGAIFVNRSATGRLAGDSDHNQTYAVDGRVGIGQDGSINGFMARSQTPDLTGNEYAYGLNSAYSSQAWEASLSYSEVAENFNPEVGFLTRTEFRSVGARVQYAYRPEDFFGLHELRPHVGFNGFWDFEGVQETGRTHIDNHWEWPDGTQVHTGMNITREGVVDSFEIFPDVVVPPGTYDHQEAQLVVMTNQGAPLSFSMRTTIGGFFGGDRVAMIPTVRFRVGETLNTEFGLSRNDIDIPGGSFVTNLARARISYSFSPRISLQTLIQYNDRADLWSANLRLAWLQQANTGLFLVYNDTRGIGSAMPSAAGRTLTLKYTQLFDILQ